jgi:hypothetical protein
LPFRADATPDREAVLARNERRRQPEIEVILLEPVLGPHFYDVAEAFGGHQCRLGATTLDQGVCGQRGAMNDDAYVGRRNSRVLGDDGNNVEYRLFRRGVVGEDLGGKHRAAHVERDVGEGAANIGTQSNVVVGSHALAF